MRTYPFPQSLLLLLAPDPVKLLPPCEFPERFPGPESAARPQSQPCTVQPFQVVLAGAQTLRSSGSGEGHHDFHLQGSAGCGPVGSPDGMQEVHSSRPCPRARAGKVRGHAGPATQVDFFGHVLRPGFLPAIHNASGEPVQGIGQVRVQNDSWSGCPQGCRFTS